MAEWVLTQRQLERWHDELNDLCFDGVLPRATFYVGRCRDPEVKCDYMALYYGDTVGSGTIFVVPEHAHDPVTAKACLAHEMIHQWQDLCNLRLDHRKVFTEWCKHIKELTGLVP